MLNSETDILSEIDITIDRLLENATALNKIIHNKEFEEEKLALEKMQESLLAHLIHMDELLKQKQPRCTQPCVKPLLTASLHNKLGRCGYLNQLIKTTTEETFTEAKEKKPKIHKRKVLAMKLVSY